MTTVKIRILQEIDFLRADGSVLQIKAGDVCRADPRTAKAFVNVGAAEYAEDDGDSERSNRHREREDDVPPAGQKELRGLMQVPRLAAVLAPDPG